MGNERYSRNAALFGAEGQQRIEQTAVTVIGLGGLGSHVAQQLAYSGVRNYGLVDFDVVTESSLNRLIGAVDGDLSEPTKKIVIAERMILAINPDAIVTVVDAKVDAPDVATLIERSDLVFGCLDRDLPRLQLVELCARLGVPLFDLASDTGGEGDELWFGGRVVLCDGSRCLVCLGLLDQDEISRDSMSPNQRELHDRIYGIERGALDDTGPMIVSINGAVASIAVTEFIGYATGLIEPAGQLTYRGDLRTIRRSKDQPESGCYFCTGIWGTSRN